MDTYRGNKLTIVIWCEKVGCIYNVLIGILLIGIEWKAIVIKFYLPSIEIEIERGTYFLMLNYLWY